MDPSRRRGLYGGTGALLWVAGAVATAPLTGGSALVGVGQRVIEASPGTVATTAIDTLGKVAQPLIVASVATGVVAVGVALGVAWPRLPGWVRTRPLVGLVGLLAATGLVFLAGGVAPPETLVAGAVLTAVPPGAFALLLSPGVRAALARDGDRTGDESAEDGSRDGRRPLLQGIGAAVAGAVVIRAGAQTLEPDDDGGDETRELPDDPEPTPATASNDGPNADASSDATDKPADVDGTARETVLTATAKQAVGTTVGAGETATATATPAVISDDLTGPQGQVRVTEVEDVGPFGFDFAGMPARVTPTGAHYVIDKNIDNPEVDTDDWQLSVGGEAAENRFELTLDDLIGHEDSVERPLTLLCISNRVGGNLVSTGRWRAVPLASLVERASPTDDGVDVVTRAVDGYSEALPLSYVREHSELLVAYGLDGETLPTQHGAPARLLVPGRYGMKSTKWLDAIEVSPTDHESYWEERGWDEEAVMHMFSYLRAVQRRGDDLAVGGVAFAGLPDVRRVDVSLDGGDTWNEATLEAPVGEYAWRRWRYETAAAPAERRIVTRVVDDTGTVQTSEETPPHPGGSTGWHAATIDL